MSPSRFETPLVLEPRPSKYLAIYLITAHLLALSALLLPMTISVYIKLVLAAGLISSLVYAFHFYVLGDDTVSPLKLTLHSDGEWLINYRNGDMHYAQLLPSSYVSRWLTVLRFKTHQGKLLRFVFLPDSFDADSWRFLRVRLTYSDAARLVGD